MRITSAVFALFVAASAATPGSALAAWQPDGVALSPAPGFRQSYDIRGLVADGAGGAFAVWQYVQPLPDLSGSNFSLAAERVDANGNRPAPWGPAGSPIRTWLDSNPIGTHSIGPLRLLDDGAGGAILPVFDYTYGAEPVNYLRLYHIAPAGAVSAIPGYGDPSGGIPMLEADTDADGASGVVMIVHGQTFAQPLETPPPSPLFVQRVNGAGVSLWPVGAGVPGPELVPAGQAGFGLAALADGVGGAFFAWIDLREAGDPDLYVQHIDAAGALAPGWPAGGVQACGATGAQFEPHLALDGAGGVIAVWRDERDGTSRLYANAVLASGALAPGIPADGRQLPSSGVDDRLVDIAADGQGGGFVVRASSTPTYDANSFLHRLDATMMSRPGWPAEGVMLNPLSPATGLVGLLPDGLGGAFVSFRNGFGSVAPQGLYAQHLAANGLPAPGWTSAGYRLSGTGMESRIVRSGTGAIVGWSDWRAGGNTVYAQAIAPDGPVPTVLALVSASAEARLVSLRWFAAGAAGLGLTIERRTETAAWEPLGDVVVDGTGNLAYEDRAVEPGVRYGYRLVWLEDGENRTSGETWISVPAGLVLALESPRPNPAMGPVSVDLTLPDARPARLEVLDLAGRRVAELDLTGLGAGRHVLPLNQVASLAPGVYTLRMEQGAAVRLARMCVVR